MSLVICRLTAGLIVALPTTGAADAAPVRKLVLRHGTNELTPADAAAFEQWLHANKGLRIVQYRDVFSVPLSLSDRLAIDAKKRRANNPCGSSV